MPKRSTKRRKQKRGDFKMPDLTNKTTIQEGPLNTARVSGSSSVKL